ncbi:MAG: hypothetical protein ABW068_10495 [Candidatus Thiodiazotropha sp.]
MPVEARSLDLQDLTPDQRGMVRRWLQLGVLALGLAGLFAVLLVVSRMPGSEGFFPWIDFFHTALVVHVDQSVLIWFLAMAGLVGAMLIPSVPLMKTAQVLAFSVCLIGTLGIALSAFIGEGAPLMNNYVPVLQRPLFFSMLGVFAVGIGLQTLLTLRGAWISLRRDPAIPRSRDPAIPRSREPDGLGRYHPLRSGPDRPGLGAHCRLADARGSHRSGLLRIPFLGRWPHPAVRLHPTDHARLAAAGLAWGPATARAWCLVCRAVPGGCITGVRDTHHLSHAQYR